MNMDFLYFALLGLAYISGSISSAVLVCKVFTLPDPRVVGSNNPGATNVLRIGGKRAALATLLGDIAKTALPIIMGIWFGYSTVELLWVGASALFGHCFPLFFGLKGGKGVACLMTLVILAVPEYGLLTLGIWLLTAWTFKRSSVASLMTAITLPVFAYQFHPSFLLPLACVSGIVLIRHRSNIVQIISGNEPIIGN
ncbi:glycerol-3-phosphate 1-O-acyltransferase PlsY [Aliikangiella sp. G2MR2-5]|uniref:glycerol-3-phosphate 1-O-acyltransferase PlsY n=1 Tax=Aliikangiella sp. G2MR2-5 TaxID=2788943 RepID=UPI0018AC0105|nr:glycerol-3-phosphate 1-O-acyltransferase PlsY [Aliikangiella sp. G2MR2-5]